VKLDSTDNSTQSSSPTRDEERIRSIIEEMVQFTNARENRDLIKRLITQSVRLGEDGLDRLDLKILTSALYELRDAFGVFEPYKGRRKLTIFGSARTKAQSPSYEMAKRLAHEMADIGWMTVTGGGPGIMEAGMLGAGGENSFGIGIRLPFEDEGAPWVQAHRVEMKYFFTRKLMLVKESDAFVALPGGFGTLDEIFEVLTLMQTGKAQLAPLVLLEPPSSNYYELLLGFVEEALLSGEFISKPDLSLITLAKDQEKAKETITRFYSNFHSMRFVKNQLVLRVQSEPSEALIGALKERFPDLCKGEPDYKRIDPTPEEIKDQDAIDCYRIVFSFNRSSYGRLRQAVDLINDSSSN
jgi:uncharacterized protein (TIGR00730 family)